MKLPYGMTDGITQALKSRVPDIEKYNFATFFVKGIYNTNMELVDNGIAPRYITLYSDNKSNLEISVHLISDMFGEVFEYDLSPTGALSESEESMDSVLLHRRSRAIKSETIIGIFKKISEDNNVAIIYDCLLKSNFVLEVRKLTDDTGSSFTARTFFRPSTADIVTDSGVLLYPSMGEAIRRVLSSEHCNYNEVIDDYFDTVLIDTPDFKGEISPPKDIEEFISIINKNILSK